MDTNPKVDQYLISGCMRCSLGGTPACKVLLWTSPLEKLRQILLESELTEDLKWGVPCYTLEDKNVIMLGAFKDNCTISFLKGSLLKDPKGILEKAGPNSQAGRIIRFTEEKQVNQLASTLAEYVREAIALEKSGAKVSLPERGGMDIPEELQEKFEENPGLEEAFYSLSPGRQRGYLIHFTGAKQSTTRSSRIEKCMPKIFEGKGMQD
jgi:uncharacterized protein YdeI (YjbR/CyaY-like superfamily)